MKKRMLSMLLALVMLCGLLPMTVVAAEPNATRSSHVLAEGDRLNRPFWDIPITQWGRN